MEIYDAQAEFIQGLNAIHPRVKHLISGQVEMTCDHTETDHVLAGCPDSGMPPLTEDKTAAMLGIVPTQAEHIA